MEAQELADQSLPQEPSTDDAKESSEELSLLTIIIFSNL
jgi:hypothetical protein